MNPFRAGDLVVIEINDPGCVRPPRPAVVTRAHGPSIRAEFTDGKEPKFFVGCYIYASRMTRP